MFQMGYGGSFTLQTRSAICVVLLMVLAVSLILKMSDGGSIMPLTLFAVTSLDMTSFSVSSPLHSRHPNRHTYSIILTYLVV